MFSFLLFLLLEEPSFMSVPCFFVLILFESSCWLFLFWLFHYVSGFLILLLIVLIVFDYLFAFYLCCIHLFPFYFIFMFLSVCDFTIMLVCQTHYVYATENQNMCDVCLWLYFVDCLIWLFIVFYLCYIFIYWTVPLWFNWLNHDREF